jgi:hypothetical protein
MQTLCCRSAPEERGAGIMAKTYRDVAIEQMIATVEEAMSRVIDWWGELPVPMKEAIDSFRVQLGGQSIPLKERSTCLLPKRPKEKTYEPAQPPQQGDRALAAGHPDQRYGLMGGTIRDIR